MMQRMYGANNCNPEEYSSKSEEKECYNPVNYMPQHCKSDRGCGHEHYEKERGCAHEHHDMDRGCAHEYVPKPMVINVPRISNTNKFYRREIWTGYNSQMTVMSIPVKGEVGTEAHMENDQIIRIEGGYGLVVLGKGEKTIRAGMGDSVFVPAGTCHNIVNVGRMPLKLSSTYSPAHHPVGTVE